MLHAALSRMIGTRRWRLRLWDGVEHGETDPEFTMVLHSRRALDRLIGALPERGFARAYVEGEIDVEPLERLFDCFAEVSARDVALAVPSLLRAVLALGARPERSRARVEAHLRGRRHTRSRDAAAIHHHYDLPPAFYRLLLGETMAYSCAYFEHAAAGIDTAQRAKFELVCRKLRLRPGERLLDVGCGFGGLVMHAAEHHGVTATGITLSVEQARWAQDACAERGLDGRVSIRAADYRDDLGAPYDAVASIGMVEHVGRARMPGYVQALRRALRPGGRALIHGITTWPEDSGINRMINAFVFPDGQLQEVGAMVSALQSEHRCATSRASATTTCSPPNAGSPSLRSTGTRRSGSSVRSGRGSGASTSPGAGPPSAAATSASTRSSWCDPTTGTRGCRSHVPTGSRPPRSSPRVRPPLITLHVVIGVQVRSGDDHATTSPRSPRDRRRDRGSAADRGDGPSHRLAPGTECAGRRGARGEPAGAEPALPAGPDPDGLRPEPRVDPRAPASRPHAGAHPAG